jgi:hypothetical protein
MRHVMFDIPATIDDLEAQLRAAMGDKPDPEPLVPGATTMPEQE